LVLSFKLRNRIGAPELHGSFLQSQILNTKLPNTAFPASTLIFPHIFTLGKMAKIASQPHEYWLCATGCTGFCQAGCGRAASC
jgi:hypothetical protein